jgi:hypothetical protein
MKSLLLIICLACVSCMHATRDSFTAVATDYDSLDVKWGQGFTATKVNQSRGTKTVTDTVKAGVNVWGIVKSVDRYLDSDDLAVTTDAASQKASEQAANAAAAEANRSAEAIKAMELPEAAAPIPAP